LKKLGDIARIVNGKIVGDPDTEILGVASLEDSKEGDLSFVLDDSKSFACESSLARALVVPLEFSGISKPCIQVKNPRGALSKILELFKPFDSMPYGVDSRSHIGQNVKIGERVIIYPFVFVGDDCVIGDDTIIHPNVVLYSRTNIGKRCIIHAGNVIGVDGFGFNNEGGHFTKVPQIGNVVIEDDVEIYSNNSIARGTMGATVIGKGTKIDNMNHIAHNVKIGKDCGITVMNAFAGSATIGDRVQMSGQCAVAPHTHVGEDTIIMGKTGVTKNIPPKSVILGYPAQDHMKENKILALVRKLPELFQRVKDLEKPKD